jgi:glycosyltransferase involved in cell wall biosynthesis
MADTPSAATTSCLRVLHVSGRSDHGGGPEHILQVIGAALPGIDHHVACPDNGIYWGRFSGILGAQRMCPIPQRSLSGRAFWRLRAFTRANDIQVIHSHGTCAGAYSRILGLSLGIPVVHTFHGVPVTSSLKHGVYNLAERLLGRLTQCGVAVSAGEADLVHARWRHYRGKLAVVPNGIDLGGEAPAWAPWPVDAPLRIVSFTRRNHQKHPELLAEIARVLHLLGVPYRIDAFGENLDNPALTAEAQRRSVGDRLRFHASTDTPARVLAGAHIYLSTSRWEGMPLAVLEAWRSGLVVIASDVVGNRDLVHDGQSGRLFPAGNGRQAARIIRDLHADPQAAERLRNRAERLARLGHCRTLMAMRLEWVYRRMVEGVFRPDPASCPTWPSQPAGLSDDGRSSRQLRVVGR